VKMRRASTSDPPVEAAPVAASWSATASAVMAVMMTPTHMQAPPMKQSKTSARASVPVMTADVTLTPVVAISVARVHFQRPFDLGLSVVSRFVGCA